MNQEQNNLDPNNFNTQSTNEIPTNPPLQDNQNLNNTFNQPSLNSQPQVNTNYQQTTNQASMEPQIPVNNSNKKENNKNKSLVLVIVFIIVILISVVVFFILNNNEKENKPIDNAPSINEKNDNDEGQDSDFDINNWGVQESIMAGNEKGLTRAFIKFPTLSGIVQGTGKIAYQTDRTLVILDSQRMSGSPEVTSDNILPAYFEQTKKIIDEYRRANYSNFDFSIDKQQSVKINDYNMVKYEGTHTYTFEGKKESIKFVAYSTKLKTNNACIYWMVLDESEDQSLSKTILKYAENMAYTLHE